MLKTACNVRTYPPKAFTGHYAGERRHHRHRRAYKANERPRNISFQIQVPDLHAFDKQEVTWTNASTRAFGASNYGIGRRAENMESIADLYRDATTSPLDTASLCDQIRHYSSKSVLVLGNDAGIAHILWVRLS